MDQITNVCNQIAEKIPLLKQKGYEEGFADGQASGGEDWYDTFWDSFQKAETVDGKKIPKRDQYSYAFSYEWNDTCFKPKYDINAKGYATSMFAYTHITDIKTDLEKAKSILNTTGVTHFTNFYANSSKLLYAPKIDMISGTDAASLFYRNTSIISAPLKNIQNITTWKNAFVCIYNNKGPSLIDIGQENSDFGYFSTSVDLSQTAIDFSTDKMSLLNYLANNTQENSWLKLNPSSQQELKLSNAQIAAAQEHLDLVTGGIGSFVPLITGMGWTVTKV